MAFTKEQKEKLSSNRFRVMNLVADCTIGRLLIQLFYYTEQGKINVSLLMDSEWIYSEDFDDLNQAISFAIRLRDIYQEAQTKYEELVKEFNTK